MKWLNKFFLLPLLLILVKTSLFSNHNNELIKPDETLKYKLFITSIDYDQKADETAACIILNDQSQWIFRIQKETKYLLEDLERDLAKGREIVITPHWQTPYYNLFPVSSKRFYVVELAQETKDILPRVEKINRIQVQPEGWLTDATYLYEVYLSDRSIWQTDEIQKRSKCLDSWNEGDSILVSRQNQGHWDLINVNTSYNYGPKGSQWDNRSFYSSSSGFEKVYLLCDTP